MRNKRTLKNYILGNDFQSKIILYNLVYLTCASILSSGIILLPDIITMTSSSDAGLKYKAALTFLELSSKIIPGIVVILIISFIHMTIITHRICGPVLHFSNLMKEFKNGNLNARIKLRKNDYLQSESDEVNEIAENFRSYFSELKEDVEKIMEDADSMEDVRRELEVIQKKLSIFDT